MKLLKALFVLAFALVFVAPAFAETQNVKVGGSIDAYWFIRDNYDLSNDDGSETTVTGGRTQSDDYFRTNTQIEVSADLTDNVSTVINIVNQRDWNQTNDTTGPIPALSDSAEFDIDLDLAYVQMKEIFYAPLTLTLGRQDLWFGRGFIIGNNNSSWDFNGSTTADEYSVTTAFDAARATLDFNPWTLDFVYSKIAENNRNTEDDLDLYIANVNYKFAEYNAVAEAYFVSEIDNASPISSGVSGTEPSNNTQTIGGRVQFDPITQMTLGGELAFQFGDYHNLLSNVEKDREAWALDIFGTYRWDNQWKPEVTLEYVYFSGEDDTTTGNGSYGSWNALYRGKFWTAYEDFRQFLYGTDQAGDSSATQNHEMIQIKGALKPMEDLLLEGAFSYFWTPESEGALDDEIGYEFDVVATYDYTEDVSFGLLAGWFIPGDKFSDPNDEVATDIVSSVKVTF